MNPSMNVVISVNTSLVDRLSSVGRVFQTNMVLSMYLEK